MNETKADETERCERCETPIPNGHHSLCGPCGSKEKREQMGHGPQGER